MSWLLLGLATNSDYLDGRLRRNSAYLGAIEIDAANRVHWALYKQSLIPRYRYANGEIEFSTVSSRNLRELT